MTKNSPTALASDLLTKTLGAFDDAPANSLTSGPHSHRVLPHWRSRVVVLVLVSGLAAGLLAMLLQILGVALMTASTLVVAAVGAVGGLMLARRRYHLFILALLAVRPELDAFKVSGAISPATGVGILFILTSLVWLWDRHRLGLLVRPSAASWGLLGVAAAAGLSALSSEVLGASIIGTARLTAGIMMFVVLEQLIRTSVLKPIQVLVATSISAALVLGHVVLGRLSGSAVQDDLAGAARSAAPFVHPSVLAKYATVIALAMLAQAVWTRRGDRMWWGLGSLAMSAVVILTYTRASWGALALGILVILTRRDWRFAPATLVLGVILATSVPSITNRVTVLWNPPPPVPGASESSLSWRTGYWADLLPLTRLNPVNGIGFETVSATHFHGLAPHNVWVQVLVEMGVVGVLALVIAVITIIIALRSTSRELADGPVVVALGETESIVETADRRASLEAAIAVALGLFFIIITENLLSETSTLWYCAAILAVAWGRPTKADSLATKGVRKHAIPATPIMG